MDKIALAKKIAKPVVAWSVSFAIGNALRNNVAPKNTLQNVELWVASLVVGAIVAEHAEKYIECAIDRAVEEWKKAFQNA